MTAKTITKTPALDSSRMASLSCLGHLVTSFLCGYPHLLWSTAKECLSVAFVTNLYLVETDHLAKQTPQATPTSAATLLQSYREPLITKYACHLSDAAKSINQR